MLRGSRPAATLVHSHQMKTVSHYRLLQRLGSGASADVFLAEDLNLKRKVAVKLLREDLTRDADLLSRFRNEAQWASVLNHPNILTIFETGSESGIHYIVTEFVEGETLRQLITRGPVPLRRILEISTAVATALAAAHEIWVVHRDVKPENIMVRPDGYVKVLDFGVAKLTQPSGRPPDSITKPRMVVGTLQYLSPEQVRGDAVDPRTDIYALGVVMYEMLTGVTPFHGSSIGELLLKILDHEPPPITIRDSGLTTTAAGMIEQHIRAIIERMLRKAASERYQSAATLAHDLRTVQQELDFQLRVAKG